jgi:molybdenum cofactor guanylyltransferase
MRGCILAGGLSSRFGSDKALFPIDGQPLALRIAERMQRAGLEPVLVGRYPRNLGIPELIEEERPGRHPLWGVAAGLETGPALFCPCDLPDLEVEHLRRLLEGWQRCPEGVYAAGQPLLGVFPASLLEKARNLAAENGRVYDFVSEITKLEIGSFKNLNFPAEAGP